MLGGVFVLFIFIITFENELHLPFVPTTIHQRSTYVKEKRAGFLFQMSMNY